MVGCFVPKCNSGHSRKVNTHSFRPSPEVALQWVKIMSTLRHDTTFDPKNDNHRVCIKHFRETDIVKVFRYIINGDVVERPRETWTLTNSAVPTRFEGVPLPVPLPRVMMPPRELFWNRVGANPEPVVSKVIKPTKFYQANPEPVVSRVINPTKFYQANQEPVVSRVIKPTKFYQANPEPVVSRVIKPTKCYQARHTSKFKIDTKGNCFMCLNLIKKPVGRKPKNKSTTFHPVCSIKKLTSCLELDLQNIFESSNTRWSSISAVMSNEVQVSLCSECTSKYETLVELLDELESIQNRVNASIREIGQLIGTEEEPVDRQPSSTPRLDERASRTSVADKLRKELIYHCSKHEVRKTPSTPRPQPPPCLFKENLPPVEVDASTVSETTDSNEGEVQMQQEIIFMYPQEGSAVDDHTTIGRFKEEDLFPRQDIPMDIDSMMETVEGVSVPSPDALGTEVIDYEEEANCTTSEVGAIPEESTLLKKTKPHKTDPDFPKSACHCPYCHKTFAFQCNVRIHVLSKHRFKVFRKYFPAGTPKQLVLSKVENVLLEYKNSENGKIGCIYCPRKFTQKDLEMLVVQTHYLLNHFEEVVSKLKGNVEIKKGAVGVGDKKGNGGVNNNETLKSDEIKNIKVTTRPLLDLMLQTINDKDDNDVIVLDVPPNRMKM